MTSILHISSPPPGTCGLPVFSTRCFYPSSPNHCGKWPKLLIHTFSIIILNQLILRNRWRSFWVGKGLQSLGLQLLQSSILRKRLTVFTAILIPPRVILALKVELLDFKIAIFPIHGVLEMNPPCTKNANSSKWVAISIFWKPWTSLGFPTKKVSVIISNGFCHETSNKDCAKLQGEDLSYITRSPTSLGLPFCISPIVWGSFPIKLLWFNINIEHLTSLNQLNVFNGMYWEGLSCLCWITSLHETLGSYCFKSDPTLHLRTPTESQGPPPSRLGWDGQMVGWLGFLSQHETAMVMVGWNIGADVLIKRTPFVPENDPLLSIEPDIICIHTYSYL